MRIRAHGGAAAARRPWTQRASRRQPGWTSSDPGPAESARPPVCRQCDGPTELATATRTWGWVLRVLEQAPFGSPRPSAAGLNVRPAELPQKRTRAGVLTPETPNRIVLRCNPMASQVLRPLRQAWPASAGLWSPFLHRHGPFHPLLGRRRDRPAPRPCTTTWPAEQAMARPAPTSVQVPAARVPAPSFHPKRPVEERRKDREAQRPPGGAPRPGALVVAGSWGVGGQILASGGTSRPSGRGHPCHPVRRQRRPPGRASPFPRGPSGGTAWLQICAC